MIREDAYELTKEFIEKSQDSGELLAFDDDDKEITRCVVEEWIDNKDDNFYQEITTLLRNILKRMRNTVDNLGILKPYSFTLENDNPYRNHDSLSVLFERCACL